MNFLKTLLATVFIITGICTQAQGSLVDEIPGFYGLEDLGGGAKGNFLIRACGLGDEDGNGAAKLATQGLSCRPVAEVKKVDLHRFVIDLSREMGEGGPFLTPTHEQTLGETAKEGLIFTVGVIGVTAGITGFAHLMSKLSRLQASFLGLGALFVGYVGLNHLAKPFFASKEAHRLHRQLIAQIRQGMVAGGTSRGRKALELFTEFVNEHGVEPGPGRLSLTVQF